MITSMVNPDSVDKNLLFFTNLSQDAQDSISWYTDNYDIFSDGSTNLNVASFRHTGLEVFVDQSGNDSNDGLTLGTAKLTVISAVTVPSVKVIQVSAGRHFKILPVQTDMLTGVSMVCDTGKAEIIHGNEDDTSNFVSDSGVYKWAGVGSCFSVWDEADLTAQGYWGFLPEESSLANLQASSGGWFLDGVDLYVKTTDNRAPDSDIRVMTLREFYYTGQSTVTHNYYQNIKFHGFMVRTAGVSNNVLAYFKNTEHAYSGTEVNANFNNTSGIVYTDGLLNHSTYSDCFSLRDDAQSVELNATAERTLKAGSNNASTTHATASAIRLNSTYRDTHGDVIGDISDLSSLMVNCTAKDTSGGASYGDFRVDANGSGLILANCNNSGSTSVNGKKGDGLVFIDGTTITGAIESPAPTFIFMGVTSPVEGPELVVNGDFPVNVNSWTPSGGTITSTWDGGQLRLDATAAFGAIDQDITCEIGESYELKSTLTLGTADAFVQVRDSSSNTLIQQFDAGLNSGQFVATTATIKIRLRNINIGQGFFDNISVKKV